jgi:hypothetical protein
MSITDLNKSLPPTEPNRHQNNSFTPPTGSQLPVGDGSAAVGHFGHSYSGER